MKGRMGCTWIRARSRRPNSAAVSMLYIHAWICQAVDRDVVTGLPEEPLLELSIHPVARGFLKSEGRCRISRPLRTMGVLPLPLVMSQIDAVAAKLQQGGVQPAVPNLSRQVARLAPGGAEHDGIRVLGPAEDRAIEGVEERVLAIQQLIANEGLGVGWDRRSQHLPDADRQARVIAELTPHPYLRPISSSTALR